MADHVKLNRQVRASALLLTIAPVLLLLAGCDTTPEDQQADFTRVKQYLPDGCDMRYLGPVRTAGSDRASKVFFVHCDGKATTSVSEEHQAQNGKATITVGSTTFEIQEVPKSSASDTVP